MITVKNPLEKLQTLVISCLLCFCGLVTAAPLTLEIITLQHRSADEIEPLVRPFLNADETIAAARSKLIVRASPRSIQSIKELIKELDVAATQLVITVVQGRDISQEELFGRSNARLEVQGNQYYSQPYDLNGSRHETRSRERDNNTQYLRTLDGAPAVITSGEHRAIPRYDNYGNRSGRYPSAGIEYREITSGFRVTPRLTGEEVTLQIEPWSQSGSIVGGGGDINVDGASTTIRARLGEWVNLGGTTAEKKESGRGAYSTYRNTRNESWNIFVKVEPSDSATLQ